MSFFDVNIIVEFRTVIDRERCFVVRLSHQGAGRSNYKFQRLNLHAVFGGKTEPGQVIGLFIWSQ